MTVSPTARHQPLPCRPHRVARAGLHQAGVAGTAFHRLSLPFTAFHRGAAVVIAAAPQLPRACRLRSCSCAAARPAACAAIRAAASRCAARTRLAALINRPQVELAEAEVAKDDVEGLKAKCTALVAVGMSHYSGVCGLRPPIPDTSYTCCHPRTVPTPILDTGCCHHLLTECPVFAFWTSQGKRLRSRTTRPCDTSTWRRTSATRWVCHPRPPRTPNQHNQPGCFAWAGVT